MRRTLGKATCTALYASLFGAFGVFGVLGTPGPAAADPVFAKEAKRDVVLITVDTWRHDAVPWLQGMWATPAPALEKLAREGRVFTFAHAHNTVTLPSHTNLLSGRYPFDHGVRDNVGFTVPARLETLATWLQTEGFATAAFVSAFPLDARFGLARGFEVYDDQVARQSGPERTFQVSERRGDATVAAALAWWREAAPRRRFLWLHLFEPHAPYEPPEPYRSLFADRPYRGEVAAVDSFLTVLFRELGQAQAPPLIVLTSDHGEGLGDHGETTHGFWAHETTLRVPLVVWGAHGARGSDDRLARHIDIAPTVLAQLGFAGLAKGLPGRNLLDRGDPQTTSYFEALSGHFSLGFAPLRGLIRGRDKYVEKPLPEFFDLSVDPQETRNLASTERRRLNEVRQLLPAESVWPPPRIENVAPEVAASLRSLGYLSEGAPKQKSYGPEDDPSRLVEMVAAVLGAENAFAAGRWDEAAKLASKVLEQRRHVPTAHSLLARALLAAGRRQEALAAMKAAHTEKLASPELLEQYGLLLIELGRAPEAVGLLVEPARGGDATLLSVLGAAQAAAGRPDQGRETLMAALAKAPNDAATLERLSAVALSLSRAEEARKFAKQATERNPASGFAWNNLGVACYLLGQRREALEAWKKAVEVDPELWDTWFNLGLKAAELGDTATARRALTLFIDRAPRERYGADLPKARQALRQLP